MTKSATATPGFVDGHVSTVNMEGSYTTTIAKENIMHVAVVTTAINAASKYSQPYKTAAQLHTTQQYTILTAWSKETELITI